MNRPEIPHSISEVGAAVHRIEEVVEHSIEHGVELAEESIARRYGLGALRGVRLALKTIAWLLVVAFFAFGTLLLATRYWILPRIDELRPRVEAIASRVLKAPVKVGRIEASWRGLNPHLALNDVRVGHDGSASLALPRVEATVSWSSLLVAEPRFSSLRILAPELQISRLAGGGYSIAGFVVDPGTPGGDPRVLDWILAQGRIAIRDARIRYRDERSSPIRELDFTEVDLLLESSFSSHRFGLQARPPSALAGPLDVRGRIRYDPLARRSAVGDWSGDAYASFDYADLAALAQLAELPLEITHAHGALRGWLEFDAARITRFTADLALKDVDARLAADLEPLKLSSLQGRVSLRQWDQSVGERPGQELVLNRLTFETASGLSFAPLNLKVRQTAATDRNPQRTEVQANRIDLESLSGLRRQLPLPRELREPIARHAVKGQISGLTASWNGPAPRLDQVTLKARFAGLSVAAQPAPESAQTSIGTPGFEYLSGTVEIDEGNGSLQLTAKGAVLDMPGVFADPRIQFDRLNASLRWKSQPAIEVRIDSLLVANRDLELNLYGNWRSAEQGPGTVDLGGRIVRAEAAAAHRYVPRVAGENTLRWLRHGLVAGRASDVSVRLKGDLARFPFTRAEEGEFRIAGRVTSATLDVAPGPAASDGRPAAPGSVWPLITGIDADLVFDRASMTINAQRGNIYGARIQNTSARIANLGHEALLEVKGQADGPLADMVRYVNASPVAQWIGGLTKGLDARGNGSLDLKLDIPFTAAGSARVAGSLRLAGNDLKLPGMPPFSRVNGTLGFSERGVRFSNVSAGFVGGTARLDAQTRADGATVVTAAGSVTPAGLRPLSDAALSRRVLDRMQGSARYSGTLTVHQGATQLQLDSDLVGFAIDGVAPLRKSADESMPLRVERSTTGSEREDLRVSLGKLVAVRIERERANGELRVTRGVIALNEPANMPESGLLVNVSLPRFDVEAWTNWLGDGAVAGRPAADAGATAASEPPVDYVALQTQELVVMRRSFRNLTLGASLSRGGVVDASVSSDNLVGHISWRPGRPGSPDSAALGRVRAQLSRLVIPNAQKDSVATVLRTPTRQLPSIELTAESFDLGDAKLGRLELSARNTGTGASAAWQLRRLEIASADMKVSATGDWLPTPSGERHTSMKFRLDATDVGGALTRLGFGGTMTRGRGFVEGAVDWDGSPFEIDYPTLSGNFQLKIDNGRFVRVDAGGAARLLTLLSLQSLARTLGTEAGGFGAGFEFTSIIADAKIERGVMSTQNFRMAGQSAAVLMSGTIDLNTETQNLVVIVLPEIDASTAALALTVVNPIVGLGTFLAQTLFRNPLSKAFAIEYDLTGSWTDPVVARRSRITPNTQEPIK